jgi:hypothetical protein
MVHAKKEQLSLRPQVRQNNLGETYQHKYTTTIISQQKLHCFSKSDRQQYYRSSVPEKLEIK